MRRIREVKWPWNAVTIGGFANPFMVEGLRVNAKFLQVLVTDGGDLCLHFEEEEADRIGKSRHFALFHPHHRFSTELEGCSYLGSTMIQAGRLAAHIYEVTTAALGAVRNELQTGQSAERMARAARGRRT